MKIRSQWLAVGMLALSACANNKNVDPNRLPKPPKAPPPPPKKVAMPIDPALTAQAKDVLAGAFASNDPVLRANSVEATQKTLGAAGAERILAGLDDSSALVRFASAMAAGRIPVPQAYDRLRNLANDPNTSVQIGAKFALHMLGDKTRTHDFEKYVQDPNPRVRANAVFALGLTNEPSALKLLGSLRGESDPAVRLEIVEAMYRLGDADARDQLVMGTVSAYPDDQIVSILALASTHDNAWARTCSANS